MEYLIQKLLEYRDYKEDMNSILEIVLAYRSGKDITESKLELNTDKGNLIVKELIKLLKQ